MAQNSLLDLQEMKPTPRNQLIGLLADALTAGRDFADKAKVPAVVPLLGGQGLGSLLLGKAPEELTNISYGNMPLRINPLAGRTASFVPEIKPGRKESLADLAMALQAVPGGNRAALSALGAVDTGANKAAIVWHGSPHKFDRFDASKIGTGEGAQAYGHGLYLAEARDVAKSYADELGQLEILHNGRRVGVFDKDPAANAAHQIRATGGDIEKAIKRAQNLYTGSWKDSVINEIRRLGPGDVSENVAGNLYKVDLPDEKIARMLDWDRPFSQQAPEVRKALQDAGVVGRDDWLISGMRGREIYNRSKFGAPVKLPLRQVDDEIYAAQRLREAGIPGIRYLDQGSRNISQQVQTAMDGLAYWNKVGDPAKIAQAERVLANAKKMNAHGTSNFVVFPGEEQFLRILERNGGLLGP